MPLYEYSCGHCTHVFEMLLPRSDAPTPSCPKCGEPGPNRHLTGTRFQLKGGGWAAQGYSKS